MSLDIKAIYIRKELLKWLENEEIRFDVVTDDECKDLDNRISSAEKTWGEAFSYEASAITVDAAVSAVMAALVPYRTTTPIKNKLSRRHVA